MNNNETKITMKNEFGFTISKSDLSTGKIVVNGVEVTDTEGWNKAIKTFSELEFKIKKKDKEIERLNNIINELEKYFKYLKEKMETFNLDKRKETGAFWYATMGEIEDNLKKIQELKGDDSNEV